MKAELKRLYENELAGNKGRAAWNARPQSAHDAQAMLEGALRTIEVLLDVMNDCYQFDAPEPAKALDRGRRAITFGDL